MLRIERRTGRGGRGPALVVLALAVMAGGMGAPARAAQAPLPTDRVPDPHQAGVLWFAATGHTLRGEFLRYWNQYGGLAQFGYPITEEFAEGGGPTAHLPPTVQYFERARFELHPENAGTPYGVLLGTLGRDFHAQDPPAPPLAQAGARYYTETGHNLAGAFLRYWDAHGGLFVNGYPISEPFQEVNPTDGKLYTVQYFERARFELHPENTGTPYEVLLGLLGTQAAQKKGYFGTAAGGGPPASYPRFGHAPDFAWIAGQVSFTRIQGGCTYVQYDLSTPGAAVYPGGAGWQTALAAGFIQEGAYVVVFGHMAGPTEPHEMCPGQPYVVDRVQANPAPSTQ